MPASNSRKKTPQQAGFSRWAEEETAYIKELVAKHTDRGVDEVAKMFLSRFTTRTPDAVKQRIFKLRRTNGIAPNHSQVVPSALLGTPLEKAVQQTIKAGGDFLLRLPTGAIVQGNPTQLIDALQRWSGP